MLVEWINAVAFELNHKEQTEEEKKRTNRILNDLRQEKYSSIGNTSQNESRSVKVPEIFRELTAGLELDV